MSVSNQQGTRLAQLLIAFVDPRRWKLLGWICLCLAPLITVSLWLRQSRDPMDPFVFGYLEAIGSVVAFTCATTAILRFRGANDRIALFVAFGFIGIGFSETFFGLTAFLGWLNGQRGSLLLPMEWMSFRTMFALLLFAAVYVEHRLPAPRSATREVLGAFALTAAAVYFTVLLYGGLAWVGYPVTGAYHPGWVIPRPAHLLPALLFLCVAVKSRKRLRHADSLFDRTLCAMAAMNCVAHLLVSQAGLSVDAPLMMAQLVKVTSYTVLLAGALWEHVRLFDQVRHLAISDPLTGLANYRRFSEALQAEAKRSLRTTRSFAILLLDLDGLKRINDSLGHDVGSRAICRLADVLRLHCRAVDTAARFGGDEFALVLPETDLSAASRVAQRIRERLAADQEKPQLSASIGVAVFPRHGRSIEALMRYADQELYAMKRSLRRKRKAEKEVTAA